MLVERVSRRRKEVPVRQEESANWSKQSASTDVVSHGRDLARWRKAVVRRKSMREQSVVMRAVRQGMYSAWVVA